MTETETRDDGTAATQRSTLMNRVGYLFWIAVLYVLMSSSRFWQFSSPDLVGSALGVLIGTAWAGVLLYNRRRHSPDGSGAASEIGGRFVAAFVTGGLLVLTARIIATLGLLGGLLLFGFLAIRYLRTKNDPGHARHLLENRLGITLLTATLLVVFFVDFAPVDVFITGSAFAVAMILEAVVTSTSDTPPGRGTPQDD